MLSRRELLRASVVSLASGIVMPNLFARALEVAAADHRVSGPNAAVLDRTLIIIQLAGGNDGLNTVIPYQSGEYYAARPTLAIAPESVIPLNDQLGLHPSLSALHSLWSQGQLAIIDGVGYDHPSLSHFQAMDIWQTADPQLARHDGWLSKLVEGLVDSQGHPLSTVALGATLPPALCCPPTPPPVLENPKQFRLEADPRSVSLTKAREAALRQLYQAYQPPAPYAALLQTTAESAALASIQMQQVLTSYQPSVSYPSTSLADGLKLFAALIAGGYGLRIGYIILGGFDTHALQADHHAQLLKTLGDAVAAFYADLQAKGHAQNTLVMTWSEFGRRVKENASHGTDHGTAAPLFVVGPGVKSGIYGEPPDLKNLDENGNLKFAVDFRSVYATVLAGWLEADPQAVLGQSFPQLPLF